MSLRERLLGKRQCPPKRDYTAIVLQAQLTGQEIAKHIRSPFQPVETPVPSTEPFAAPKLSNVFEPPPPLPVVTLPQRGVQTIFNENFSPSKAREVVVDLKGPATVVDIVFLSASNDYSIMASKDGQALYSSSELTHTQWTKLSITLAKVVATTEADGTYIWAVYDIPFQRDFKVSVVNGTSVTFSQVMGTWEILT